jgi:hypothetical protein
VSKLTNDPHENAMMLEQMVADEGVANWAILFFRQVLRRCTNPELWYFFEYLS